MNGIVKTALRISMFKSIAQPLRNTVAAGNLVCASKIQFTRNLWHMASRCTGFEVKQLIKPSNVCTCGCGVERIHTKGEKELVEFLSEEIAAERKLRKISSIPTEVDGFKVKLDGSEVTLTKKGTDETISVNFNINHTVDAEVESEPNPKEDEAVQMRSTPNFEVDIQRGPKTLSFTCSFMNDASDPSQESEGYNDVFGIDEVTMYEGEWNDKVYAVAGDVLDGYLYDLLMNFLEEKGVSNDFVEKLSELSTSYEHSAYIALLENLQKFSSGK